MKVTDTVKVTLAALISAILGYTGLVLGEEWAVNFIKVWSVIAGLVGILIVLTYSPPKATDKRLSFVKDPLSFCAKAVQLAIVIGLIYRGHIFYGISLLLFIAVAVSAASRVRKT